MSELPSHTASLQVEQRIAGMLSERYHLIARWLRRYGVRDGDTDDVAQRVLLTFVKRASSVRPGAEHSFLYAIALREAAHQRRSYRRRQVHEEPSFAEAATTDDGPDQLTFRKEAVRQVRTILSGMDPLLRMVLTLFDLEEMAAPQVADMLGVPVGTVKSRLKKARALFAQEAERN